MPGSEPAYFRINTIKIVGEMGMVENRLPMKQELQTPQLPEHWDYEDSIIYLKPKIVAWKNLTIDIATELWI